MPRRKNHIIYLLLLFFGISAFNSVFSQDFVINVVRNNVTCHNAQDGIASCIPEGGATPYQFLWNNGETTATIIDLDVGTYTVTVTDATGTTATNGTFIEEPEPLVAVMTTQHGVCNENGSAEVQVSGGTAPYSFLWSDGEMGPKIQDKTAGMYEVIVSDIRDCSTNAAGMIEVDTNNVEFVTTIVRPTCHGEADGYIEIEMIKGTPPYLFRWNEEELPKDIYNLETGSYSLFIRDAMDCAGGTTIALAEPSELRLNFINSDNGLIGRPEGGTPPYVFQWSTGYTDDGYLKDIEQGNVYGLTVTDSQGCEIEGEAEYLGPLSLFNHPNLEQLSIYPNPADQFIQLNIALNASSSPLHVRISNLQGQILEIKEYPQGISIEDRLDVYQFPNGLYFLNVYQGTIMIGAERFLIER